MRTIVDLPDAQIAALGELCRQRGLSRAEAVRQAVDAFLKEHAVGNQSAFGLWKKHLPVLDSLDDQSNLSDERQ